MGTISKLSTKLLNTNHPSLVIPWILTDQNYAPAPTSFPNRLATSGRRVHVPEISLKFKNTKQVASGPLPLAKLP